MTIGSVVELNNIGSVVELPVLPGNENIVNIYSFYQVYKVHDIVSFGHQAANARSHDTLASDIVF